MSTTTEYRQIILDANGDAIIRGTTTKVLEVVREQQAYGWTPAEIHLNHRYLSMEQIHAAFAYYWANKATLDAEITRRERYAEALRAQLQPADLVAILRERDRQA